MTITDSMIMNKMVQKDILKGLREKAISFRAKNGKLITVNIFLRALSNCVVSKELTRDQRDILLIQIFNLCKHYSFLLQQYKKQPLVNYLRRVKAAKRGLLKIDSDMVNFDLEAAKKWLYIREIITCELLKYYSYDQKNLSIMNLFYLLLYTRLKNDLRCAPKVAKKAAGSIATLLGLSSTSSECIRKRLNRLEDYDTTEYMISNIEQLTWPEIRDEDERRTMLIKKGFVKKVARPIIIEIPNRPGYYKRTGKNKTKLNIQDYLVTCLETKKLRYGVKPQILRSIGAHFGFNSEEFLNELMNDQAFCSAVESCRS